MCRGWEGDEEMETKREREVGPYPSRMGGRHERGREIGSYPSHCSHVRPHLIGQFVMSLQEEDGRPDRSVRG